MEFDRSAKVRFEQVAVDYDRFRPGYPDAALTALIDLSAVGMASRLLEVGCGTGQATLPLASKGFQIDAVELGPDLAAIAAKKCSGWPRTRISVGPFESFAGPAAGYDLIYSAQAFHWIDPDVRLAKSACLLKPGGSLALLYNTTPHLEGALKVLSDRLFELTGVALGTPQRPVDMDRWEREFAQAGLFQGIRRLDHPWQCTYDADAYAGLFRTYSDFGSLSEKGQDEVAQAIRRTVQENGGTVTRPYVCTLIHARRAG